MNFFNLFDHTYILNLPERKDRKEETRKELQIIAPGYDTDVVQFFPAIRPNSADGWETVGRRGSLLSHLSALKEFKRNEIQSTSVLLLEDDVSFDVRLKSAEVLTALSDAINTLEWDFLYIGHGLATEKGANKIDIRYETGHILFTHCLAFHSRNLEKFINYLEQTCERPRGHPLGGRMGFDGAINTYRQLGSSKTLVIRPSLAKQRSSLTDLGREKWFDRVPICKEIVQGIRQLKTAIDQRHRRN